MSVLQYVPYVLLFAIAVVIIYGWGLRRSMRQGEDLTNLLSSKGISRIRKALKKNGSMTRAQLEDEIKGLTASQPFSKKRMGVTNPRQFVDSLIPYMTRQRMIEEIRENNKIYYRLRKD